MKKVLVYFSYLALSMFLLGCTKEESLGSVPTNIVLVQQEAKELENVHQQEHEHNHDHDHDHDHHHTHELDEQQKAIYSGYFEDEQVYDRALSDWEGDWQSVYPYLQDGTLDEVFEHKATNGTQTFEEFKTYYEVGYKTSTERIVINNNVVTFYEHGHEHTGKYEYDGYEILTYDKGNRGVRYIFKHVGEDKEMPNYIQFSDHIIAPQKADHYHLYWGNDRDALLREVTNWPTYYPSHMDGHDIAHEMIMH